MYVKFTRLNGYKFTRIEEENIIDHKLERPGKVQFWV